MKHLNHILCPVDFTPSSYHAIEQASFLAQLFQADLTLLHIVNVVPYSTGMLKGNDIDSQEMMLQAEEKARQLLRESKKAYVPYSVECKSSIRFGQVADGIVQEAKKLNAGLVVMDVEGDNDDVLKGDIVQHVIQKAPCPVLAYRRQGESMGYRKVLVPIFLQPEMGEVLAFVRDYLSQMGPEVHLLAFATPDTSESKLRRVEALLEQETEPFVSQGLEVVTQVMMVPARKVSTAISAYAKQQGCKLVIMKGAHSKKTEKQTEQLAHSLL
ncbi:MAG: universal stress protein, partial [Bacteroidota bacterium]